MTKNARGDLIGGSGDNQRSEPHYSRGSDTGSDEMSSEEESETSSSVDSGIAEEDDVKEKILSWYQNIINTILGVTVMSLVGYFYAWYIYTLHENRMWFTNIMEVEREISFRTEAGLYYSYYKQMIASPSFAQGLYELTHDDITENWRTINVIQRFNIFQEIFLAAAYRSLPFIQDHLSPIFFYIHSVFALHGAYIMVLFMLGWLLSNSWLTGSLATAFYVCNRSHTTRVDFTVPLRESFSLPFLYLQILAVTVYLRPSRRHEVLKLLAIFTSTLLFTVTWQFAQFILLLQMIALYGSAIFGIVSSRKVKNLLQCITAVMLLVSLIQFGNNMLPSSLAVSFGVVAVLELVIKQSLPTSKRGLPRSISLACLRATLTIVFAAVLNLSVKYFKGTKEDQHIFKFLSSKFDLSNYSNCPCTSPDPQRQVRLKSNRDFDTLLYLCNAAFDFMPWSMAEELIQGLVLPLYLLTVTGLFGVILVTVFQRSMQTDNGSPARHQHSLHLLLSHPELCFHALQSALFGVMAVTVMRMKYVWTPQVCAIAAFGVSCHAFWRTILIKIGLTSDSVVEIVRNSAVVVMLSILLSRSVPSMSAELEVLREFYDPDTVELMNWIDQQTPKDAAFSGSMQLLAGVKLCTGRKLTNHPHFEDKELRERTFQLYQFYAKRSVEEVHAIHLSSRSDFIILEDSICLSRNNLGCRLVDIIDKANGHTQEYKSKSERKEGIPVSAERFCAVIKKQLPEHARYFRKVFQNRTFRIYQVMTNVTSY